jgi:hypothetical protein
MRRPCHPKRSGNEVRSDDRRPKMFFYRTFGGVVGIIFDFSEECVRAREIPWSEERGIEDYLRKEKVFEGVSLAFHINKELVSSSSR